MEPLHFSLATRRDIDALVELVNLAYRGQGENRGWTTEADLIVGDRISAEQLFLILSDSDSRLLTTWRNNLLAGCVHLQKRGESVFLGMLSVHPKMQAKGIGKALMSHAEQFAREEFRAKRIEMCVIAQRTELLAYYQRRGYRFANRQGDFPLEANAGVPRCGNLRIEYLCKEWA